MGIDASGVPRENVFLTTKLANDDHGNVEGALETSLKRLNTPYLDLCMSSLHMLEGFDRTSPGLMHWPAPMTPGEGKPNIDSDQ
jgi:glycerol 2-dehydrogenase (NADP+)